MNGPHDLGGQMGFGAVAPEKNEPYFHAEWEKRALGVTLTAGGMGHWNIDESRHARESLHPADYYASSYYEIWIKALETLLQRHGFVTAVELAEGRSLGAGTIPKRKLAAADVPDVLARGGPCNRPVETKARFQTGDRVRTINMNPTGHTRLPRYARGKVGVIDAVREGFVFPDSNAHGQGEQPQWVYTVLFDGREIWGEASDPQLTVSIDAWESYLEPEFLINVRAPNELDDDQMTSVVSLIASGAEVKTKGLKDRIAKSKFIILLELDGILAACAAVKNPAAKYRSKAFAKSKSMLNPSSFDFELGYVVVSPPFRRRGLSSKIVSAALNSVGGSAIYATTRHEHVAKLLLRAGLRKEGASYPSDENRGSQLSLFVRSRIHE